ncbi:MAG: hypothetical protein NC489_29450 [Ruminococcus flavefaciens]|nr:hypothetical protein [Ruminococcus flavefaciens]
MKKSLSMLLLVTVYFPICALELEYIQFTLFFNEMSSEDMIDKSDKRIEKSNYIYFYIKNDENRLKIFTKDLENNEISQSLALELSKLNEDFISLTIYDGNNEKIGVYEISFLPDNIVKVNNDKFYMYKRSYDILKNELIVDNFISAAIAFLGNGFYLPFYNELYPLFYFDDNKYFIKKAELYITFLWSEYINAANATFTYSNGKLLKLEILDKDDCKIYELANSYSSDYTLSKIYITKRENQHDSFYLIHNKGNCFINAFGESITSNNITCFSEMLIHNTIENLKTEEEAVYFMNSLK